VLRQRRLVRALHGFEVVEHLNQPADAIFVLALLEAIAALSEVRNENREAVTLDQHAGELPPGQPDHGVVALVGESVNFHSLHSQHRKRCCAPDQALGAI